LADSLDITPDTKILVALTRTPLAPLDALCELIDNSIDSFLAAAEQGAPIRGPLVRLTVPQPAEIGRGGGMVRIVDNGPGLTLAGIQNALRAGWTSKNPFDTLGLFGMGFNIATGKLGQRTILTTARADATVALQATLDIPSLLRSHSFSIPVVEIPKPEHLSHGTIVEVDRWWPDGDPNSGFIRRLADIPKRTVREQIGRRYATLLRGAATELRVLVNEDGVTPFEHCVWAADRFVERGKSRYPAQIAFDEVIHSQRRCSRDGTAFGPSESTCPECGGQSVRTVVERISGWVGIQRFDDNDRYGIDLIRNGRAIRVLEKEAFFVHVDETTKEGAREYPTDQQTGRIVGEVHLDHVPVDFQKQDFQRTSDEWTRAIAFLRGGSLLPSKWGASPNLTPVSQLFQGYRKVRNYGRPDMYMGQYNPAKKAAERIPREVERDLYERFLRREPGFFDDARWWELVESATTPPVEALPECPACGFQNSPSEEVCADCGSILSGRPCVVCAELIARSAVACSHCGASQLSEVAEPWQCAVCSSMNGVDAEVCAKCASIRGAENPMSLPALLSTSVPVEELSFQAQPIPLADGTSQTVAANTYAAAGGLAPTWGAASVPVRSFKSASHLDIFVDRNHRALLELGLSEESLVAIEVAQYVYELNRHLIGKPDHSVAVLATAVMDTLWGDRLAESDASLRESIQKLFAGIADRLVGVPQASDFYQELTDPQQLQLADSLIAAGRPLDELGSLKGSGGYLRYVDGETLVAFFRHSPDAWFGSVWVERLPDPLGVGESVAERGRAELVSKYLRCLEDLAAYIRYKHPEPLIISRSRASRDFLEAKLA